MAYQHPNGGWPKNIDMARPLSDEERAQLPAQRETFETLIDNGATYTQIRYLARVHAATDDARLADAASRGIQYVLDAQYPHGGWPMIYPLQRNYTAHVTFNDGGRIGVMALLRDIARGESTFDFVNDAVRQRAAQAIDRGLDVILKCQVVVDGRPTVWCAQHDARDFSPAKARTYELPSLSGSESVEVVQYLMDIDDPSPEVRAAIESAVAWVDAVRIEGWRLRRIPAPGETPPFDYVVVEDDAAGPLWARFYEIGSNRPMFVGRDGVVRQRLDEIEPGRRTRYAHLGGWARDLLQRDYPRWQSRWGS